MITEYERELRHSWMILEFDQIYEEDYQMRMLRDNHIPGMLSVQGQGLDEKSRYRYEISGKINMKTYGEQEGWSCQHMETFMRQFVQVLNEINNYMLNVNCLSLRPEHIYWNQDIFYFCYCPIAEMDLWEEFHKLTEYFVKEINYEDKEAIYFAYEFHKASMEENYNIEEILEKILERKEAEMERVKIKSKEMTYEIEDNKILDDWAGEQELKGQVVKERQTVWGFINKRMQKR